jgi:hypothetical protein
MEKINLIRNIYTYALSGITLIIFLISLIRTLTGIPDIIYPNTYIQPFSGYKSMTNPPAANTTQTLPVKSESELKREWEDRNNQQRQDEKIRASKEVIKSAVWTIVSLGAYIYFYSELKKKLA